MDKSNQFRSSLFHMDEGDVLHILVIDEQGTPLTVSLNTEYPDGTNNEGDTPGAPIAIEASDVLIESFTANWYMSENTLGYYLDVATSIDFTTFVGIYNNFNVGNVDSYNIVGLTEDTAYYYRVRGYNDIRTSASSNIIETLTDNTGALMDKDGNIYTTITIGAQKWIIENFKSTTYADDAAIVNIVDNATFTADTTGAYCWYDNDEATYGGDYGALYNWYAVNNASGLAYLERSAVQELGWRVPTEADWDELAAYLGGYGAQAGGKMKEAGIVHWTDPNTGATNESGFTALGGGLRNSSGFALLRVYGMLHSSDSMNATDDFGVYMLYQSDNLTPVPLGFLKSFGATVRLVLPLAPLPANLVDKDGNIYTTITIGTQIWTIENLRTTTYADGTAIPNITNNAAWMVDATGAYCYYNNDEATYKDDYGVLYNWHAVNNASGLVYLEENGVEDTDWRIPTETDFNTLVSYLGGQSIAGGKLKEAGLSHWLTPNTGATNETGFTALPGGWRRYSDGYFLDIGGSFYLWSADLLGTDAQWNSVITNDAIFRSASGESAEEKRHGFAVRLVKDV